jgi:hypothetical protein
MAGITACLTVSVPACITAFLTASDIAIEQTRSAIEVTYSRLLRGEWYAAGGGELSFSAMYAGAYMAAEAVPDRGRHPDRDQTPHWCW